MALSLKVMTHMSKKVKALTFMAIRMVAPILLLHPMSHPLKVRMLNMICGCPPDVCWSRRGLPQPPLSRVAARRGTLPLRRRPAFGRVRPHRQRPAGGQPHRDLHEGPAADPDLGDLCGGVHPLRLRQHPHGPALRSGCARIHRSGPAHQRKRARDPGRPPERDVGLVGRRARLHDRRGGFRRHPALRHRRGWGVSAPLANPCCPWGLTFPLTAEGRSCDSQWAVGHVRHLACTIATGNSRRV